MSFASMNIQHLPMVNVQPLHVWLPHLHTWIFNIYSSFLAVKLLARRRQILQRTTAPVQCW